MGTILQWARRLTSPGMPAITIPAPPPRVEWDDRCEHDVTPLAECSPCVQGRRLPLPPPVPAELRPGAVTRKPRTNLEELADEEITLVRVRAELNLPYPPADLFVDRYAETAKPRRTA